MYGSRIERFIKPWANFEALFLHVFVTAFGQSGKGYGAHKYETLRAGLYFVGVGVNAKHLSYRPRLRTNYIQCYKTKNPASSPA